MNKALLLLLATLALVGCDRTDSEQALPSGVLLITVFLKTPLRGSSGPLSVEGLKIP